jgi:hypothetical protein
VYFYFLSYYLSPLSSRLIFNQIRVHARALSGGFAPDPPALPAAPNEVGQIESAELNQGRCPCDPVGPAAQTRQQLEIPRCNTHVLTSSSTRRPSMPRKAKLNNTAPQEAAVRVNLLVPSSMRKRWKTAAVQEDRPMSDIIIEAVNQYMDAHHADKSTSK